jgi:hypothetical protein
MVWFIVFNTTFNNISVILWWSILLVEETEVPGENHQPVASLLSEFDSTGVKLYIFIHNEVRDFDKNSTQPEIRVNRIRDNESQL